MRSTPRSWAVVLCAAAAAAIALAGCQQSAEESHVTTTVDEITSPEAIPAPGPELEVAVEEPSGEHVWIPGYWERTPTEWKWVRGHWEKPPHKDSRWVKGYWGWDGVEWRWIAGHWAATPPGQGLVTDEIIEIPPLIEEKRPPQPTDTDHWIPGYWEWNGWWEWVPGHWTKKPNPDADWVPGRWASAGDHHRRWIAGHWTIEKK